LRDSGIKLKFVTNTTKESLRLLHDKVTKLGFNIDRDEIFTSLTAARRLVDARGYRPFTLLEESAKEDFEGFFNDTRIVLQFG
jgi:ribonucleotide monophosphatase NagD (HAD superfamily)